MKTFWSSVLKNAISCLLARTLMTKVFFYYDNLALKNSNVGEMLGVTIDRKFTFHQHTKNICRKALIYKKINHTAPPIMQSLFEIHTNCHNMRHFQVLSNKSRRTVNYGLETICYRTPFLLANLPPEYKFANSLNIFKRKLKNWKVENYLCWLCKTYVRELGYI